jgi:hypothetical protein
MFDSLSNMKITGQGLAKIQPEAIPEARPGPKDGQVYSTLDK